MADYSVDWSASGTLTGWTVPSILAAVGSAKLEVGTGLAGTNTNLANGAARLYVTSTTYQQGNGKVGAIVLTGDAGPAWVNPANGGSAYCAFIYGGALFLSRRYQSGSATNIVSNLSITGGSVPSSCYIELTRTGAGTNSLTLTTKLYDATVGGFDPTAPGTPFHSSSYTDDVTSYPDLTANLLPGIGGYSSGTITKLASTSVSSALSKGTVSTLKVGTDWALFNLGAANGGTSPYSYVVSVNGTQVASGFSTGSYELAGLSARTRNTIVFSATDSAGTPATVAYDSLDVLTGGADLDIVGVIGDSNTDPNYSSASESQKWPLLLEGKGRDNRRPITTLNYALAGVSAQQWAADYNGMLTTFKADITSYKMTSMVIDAGTNDTKVSGQRTKAQYKADIATIINEVRGVKSALRIFLTIGPYITGSSVWNTTSSNARMVEYVAALNEIIADTGTGGLNASGTIRGLGLGFYADSVTNASAWGLTSGDNPHYNATGHTAKAALMWTDYVQLAASSGGGGSNEMTVTDTVKASLTNSWAEVKDRSAASLTGSAFFVGFANLRGQIVEYAVVDAAENIQIGTEVSSLAPMINAKVIGTGKKLFMRSKSGVSIDIPLEVGTA